MSIIHRCSALHLRLANKLSPYLREKVVKRMMVHVSDAVGKGVKSVMFPTRDTAVVTVSSITVVTLDASGTFGVLIGTGKILTVHLFVKSLSLSAVVPGRGATQHRSFFSRPRKKTA